MILRVSTNALPKYLEIILRSPTAVDYFNNASVGSTMVNLNQKVIKELKVYFPDLNEQTEIVSRVEALFAFADRIEQAAQAALSRVNNLTQSILAKAFRGELTADWRAANPDLISGDNSAEALLVKIKAERAKLTKKAKAKA
jgi:type I restriction enzyme S subunit